MKKYFILSGLELNDNNRGTAALGYGAFSFLEERGFIDKDSEVLIIKGKRNIIKGKEHSESLQIQGVNRTILTITVPSIQTFLARRFGILLPLTKIKKYLKKTSFVASINGGDGFSDIYGDRIFQNRLSETILAMKCGLKLIFLPQTVGPFYRNYNFSLAQKILKYASKIFVRDNKFIPELNALKIQYEKTKDLSAYMKPEPFEIDIKPDSIGLNVSGLCYANLFDGLIGQFDAYPDLINDIITNFQDKGKTIYLIPHSYNFHNPERSNDDIIACRQAYERLKKKDNVILIDKDLISPQIKYIISKMSFFIGARMHANFAAIYTHVPVFGTAYSYKFEGAFDANNLNGSEQTAMINNISKSAIPTIITKINNYYNKALQLK